MENKQEITEEPKKHRRIKRLPVFVSAEDLLAIMKVARHKHHKFAYMMAWYSGLRISELLNLEPRDVDMKQGTILVRQGKGSKDGVTILSPIFREEMFELMPLKKLIKARALQKAFKLDCKNAGILEKKPSIHFHSLRHGFCTHAVENGIDITRVQVLARHSNIATTSVYTHLNPKIALDDFRRLF
jgi:integrase/recombinase XerD